jgi:hypothetical protein
MLSTPSVATIGGGPMPASPNPGAGLWKILIHVAVESAFTTGAHLRGQVRGSDRKTYPLASAPHQQKMLGLLAQAGL